MINGEKEMEKKQIDVSLGTLYDVNKSIINSMKKLSTEEIEEKIPRVEHFSSIIYLKHITVAVTRKSTSELC